MMETNDNLGLKPGFGQGAVALDIIRRPKAILIHELERGSDETRVRQSDYSKATPNLFSLRWTTWQASRCLSAVMIKVKRSGIPRGLSTSRAAPVSEILRMEQSMTLPPNSILAAFKTR